MKPKTHITRTSSSRPTGGIFISDVFPGEICAELTEVNKPPVINYESTNCKHPISPVVKPAPTTVNKINTITTHYVPLLTNYPIPILTNCQLANLSNSSTFGATFCPLFAAGKAFAITFANDFQKKA